MSCKKRAKDCYRLLPSVVVSGVCAVATSTILISVLSIFVFGSALIAQTRQPSVQHLNARYGLTDDSFNAFVFEDSQGFIWISSMNGCYRFDGQSIDHFPLDQSGEYDNAVVSPFFEDGQGDIYFTSSDCLYRYSPSENRFYKFPILGKDRQLQRGVHAFHLDAQHDILWLSNVEHTWRFDTKKEQVVGAQFAGGHMRYMHLSTRGDTSEFLGFSWLLAKGCEYWTVIGDSLHKRAAADTSLQRATISGGLLLESESIWLFSDRGLLQTNRDLQESESHRVPEAVDPTISGGVMINDSILLVALRKDGLRHFNVRSKKFGVAIRSDPEDPESIQTDRVAALTKTGDRWVWAMQIDLGLDYFDVRDLLAQGSSILPAGRRYLDVVSAQTGELYALCESGEVVKRGLNGLWSNIPLHGADQLVEGTLSIDSSGLLWAVAGKRVFRQNKREGRLFAIEKEFPEFKRLLRLIHLDRDHYLFGISGVWKIKDGSCRDVTSSFVEGRFLNASIIQLERELFALPIESHRLDLFSYTGETFTLLQQIELNVEVNDAVLDTRGDTTLVLATLKGVLYLDKGDEGVWSVFRREHTDRVVERILLDAEGTLWCWSDRMIGRRSIGDKDWSFRNVPGTDVKHPSAHLLLNLDDAGVSGFTEDGVVSYAQLEGDSLSEGPEVYIDEIWINERPYLDKASYLVDSLSLGSQESTLEFRVRPKKALFSGNYSTEYRLAGYQEQWTSFDPEDRLRFSELKAGSYRFQARVTDPTNRTGPIKQLVFSIKAPFHQTPAFYVLLLGTLAGIVYMATALVYRRRLLNERKLRLRQELIDRERDRIAGELHDDLGTELSSIRFLSEDIANELDSPEALRISQLSKNAIVQMRDIIWALNSEEGELGHLEERCAAFTESFSKQHNLAYDFISNTTGHLGVRLSGDVKRNLFLILRELLQNTLKHADANKVEVSLSATESSLTLTVRDDGSGYQVDSPKRTGYGLANIRRRVNQIRGEVVMHSQLGEGTFTTIEVGL